MFGTNHGSNAQTYQMVTMDGKLLTLRLKSQAMVTISYSLNCAKHRRSYFLILFFTRINRFWLVWFTSFVLYGKETGFACLIVVVLFLRVYLDENRFLLVGLAQFICVLSEENRFCLFGFVHFFLVLSVENWFSKMCCTVKRAFQCNLIVQRSTIILSINCVNLIS